MKAAVEIDNIRRLEEKKNRVRESNQTQSFLALVGATQGEKEVEVELVSSPTSRTCQKQKERNVSNKLTLHYPTPLHSDRG